MLPAGIRKGTCSHICELFITEITGNLSLLMIKTHFSYSHITPGPYLEEKNQISKTYDKILRTAVTWTCFLFQIKDLEKSITVILTYCHFLLG